MKNIELIFKIILPALLCIFILQFINNDAYYALVFGLVIGIVNWRLHKHTPLLGILLGVLLSNIVFFACAFGYIYIAKTLDFIKAQTRLNVDNWSTVDIPYTIVTFIIAPLLLFYVYKLVFNVLKNKFTLWTITISIFVLVLINILSIKDDKDNLLNLYSLWQMIMALGLQLILYQKELKKFFYKNKE